MVGALHVAVSPARARRHPIRLPGQRHEVNARLNPGKRITQRVDPSAVTFIGEQISLDGGTLQN